MNPDFWPQSLSSFSFLTLSPWYLRKWPRGHLTKFSLRAGFHSRIALTCPPPPMTGSSSPCWKSFPLFIYSLYYYFITPTNHYEFHSLDLILLSGPQNTGLILLPLGQNSDIQKPPKYHPTHISSSPAYTVSCPSLRLTSEFRGKSSHCVVKRNKNKLRSGIQRLLSSSDFQDTQLSWLSPDTQSISGCFFPVTVVGSSSAVPLKAGVLKSSAWFSDSAPSPTVTPPLPWLMLPHWDLQSNFRVLSWTMDHMPNCSPGVSAQMAHGPLIFILSQTKLVTSSFKQLLF